MLQTQGTIAHALEKTKYEDSDAKWKDSDPKYHFSCQFTADIISMNAADFIITSTFQEIAGRLRLFSFFFFLSVLIIQSHDQTSTVYVVNSSVRIGLDSMKATQHLPCQDFIGWSQASMSLIQSSTLQPLGLTNLSTSPTLRVRGGYPLLALPLKSYCTVRRITRSTCKSLMSLGSI